MASNVYSKLLPNYDDLDNESGTAPGYRVYILEKDGGISLQVIHANENPISSQGYAVFMNVDEAREFQESFAEAIDRAAIKSADHPARGKDC
jgi:hypothetical protein